MKKISIIGCGWLGLPLGETLVRAGYTVKGSTTRESKMEIIENSGIQPFLIDLNKMDNWNTESETDKFFETDLLYINIPPARKNPNIHIDYPKWIDFLAQKCKSFGIKKVIFVSSTGVYPNTDDVVTEAAILSTPQSLSQQAIIDAEYRLFHSQDFETTILRPAGLVGGNRVAARWFAGKKNVKGGNIPVNLAHLEDCIGVSVAVIKQAVFGEVINICADEHPTKSVFYKTQAEKYGMEVPTFSMEDAKDFKIVSNEKSRKILNYSYIKPNPMDF